MNRVTMHVGVILITGVIIGLIVRSRRAESITAPAAKDVSPSLPAVIPPTAGWLSSFELTERSGRVVTSEELKGQPYVVSFFFTTCPSTCPMQNAKLRILQEEFKGDEVRFLSISCDPEVDTPEVLREYADTFNADAEKWLFLTGDLTYIRRVGAEVFQLPVNRKFHTDRFVLVDKQGRIAAFYEWKEQSQFERLQTDIRKILNGEPIGQEQA